MKKKFGAILAAGVMSCAMVAGVAASGCGMAQIYEFEMPKGGYDGSAVTITFAHTAGQKLSPIIKTAIEERFKAIYPNITVNIDNSNKNYDALETSIGTKLTTGRQPHVAFCYADHIALYNESNAVLALNDFFYPGSGYEDVTATTANGKVPLCLTQDEVDDYVKEFCDVYETEDGTKVDVFGDGKVYTIPFQKSTEVLYYNKTFFEAHPELKVPETWDEMGEVCEKILALDEFEDESKYPLGYDSEANWFITMCEQSGSGYTSATGDHFLFNNQTNKDFVEKLVGWYNKGYFLTKSTNKDSYTSYLFTGQKCVMSIGSTGGASYQEPTVTDEEADFEVGVAQIPQVDKTNPKSILQGPSLCIFKKQNPQEVLASWLLVKFLSTEVRLQESYAEVSGYMPVTYTTLDNDLYTKFLAKDTLTARTSQVCADMIENKAFYTSDAFSGSSKARERVGILMEKVLAGEDINAAFTDAINKCKSYAG